MLSKPQLQLLTGAALAAALSVGCATSYRGNANTLTGNDAGEIVVTETNRGLARTLAIINPRHKDQNGYMMIEFDLENRSSRQVDFAWAIDWFDRDGFHINSNQRHFQPLTISGSGSRVLTAVAPHHEAASWKLQVTSRDEVK